MKILFTGGGTLGSVVPLLAIGEELKKREPNADFFWIGTQCGPESAVVRNYNIEFKAISAGKLRRYFSLQNLVDILRTLLGLAQSFYLLVKWKPNVIVSCGGYVAVPVVWAGWLLGLPAVIHQQDIRVGLANKLCARAAAKITVCFPESAGKFKSKSVAVVGNPVREALKNKNTSFKPIVAAEFGLSAELPLVLITTGGRGALAINKVVSEAVAELLEFCQIIHLTGKDKDGLFRDFKHARYRHFDFMVDDTAVIAAADLIISRAGMGTLTEIAYLAKPALVIPIPGSHQEENAAYFHARQAIELMRQEEIESETLVAKVRELLGSQSRRDALGKNAAAAIRWGAEEQLAEIILRLVK